MQKNLKFLIVDDDESSAQVLKNLLEKKGQTVFVFHSSEEAYKEISHINPDCVLSDLLMPGIDGIDLFQRIRKKRKFPQPIFIIVTAKIFSYDKERSFQSGVNGYIQKPINPERFVQEVEKIIEGVMTIEFWGVRGTLPVPGRKSVRFGGNTNCVTLKFANRNLFIFDAGTGIKELSNYLIKEHKEPLVAKIFISHPHYDHINGLPFFVPLYCPQNQIEILGTNQGELTIDDLVAKQMDTVYFPVTIKEFAAKLSFRNLDEESIMVDDIKVSTMLLNHPGRCLGFAVEHRGKKFCYITDNELYLKNSPQYNEHDEERLTNFIQNADVLIIDATYNDKEYAKKVGWGHSAINRVVEVADKAKIKLLCLYHHSHDHYDKDIAAKLKKAKALLKEMNSQTVCIAPREGDQIIL